MTHKTSSYFETGHVWFGKSARFGCEQIRDETVRNRIQLYEIVQIVPSRR